MGANLISKGALLSLLAFLLFVQVIPSLSQEGLPDGPLYIVKEGDSLWDIAVRFGVSLDDLKNANRTVDPGNLVSGDQLVIPVYPEVSGIIDTVEVPFGETLRSLSRRYQIAEDQLAQMNRLTNPSAIFVGSNLILPADRLTFEPKLRAAILPGQSLLEIAVLNNSNPWTVMDINALPVSSSAIPGDVLLLPASGPDGPSALPEVIESMKLSTLPLAQGDTVGIWIFGTPGLELSGSLAGNSVRFFPFENGYVALQGIHAMTEPGLYPLTLKVEVPTENSIETNIFEFSQQILVNSADYPFDPALTVDPGTVDPAVTEPEDKLWTSLGESYTPEKYWDGVFQSPVPRDLKNCWTSLFGSRRSFNGSPYRYFHSGLDFCGTIGTELYSAAPGKVVFAGLLTVRGNVVVIDHGWGVFTAYDHLSEILVKSSEMISSGQVIGLGGETGRTTGPHLHWEVWVGGVQVDPVDWLEKTYP